jgi:hypothetical protein
MEARCLKLRTTSWSACCTRSRAEVDLDEVDHAESLQDVADLDSTDFLSLMSALYTETGIDVPERDYPSVRLGRRVRHICR